MLDNKQIHIAVIGDVILDIFYYGDVDHISPEAPVPILKTNKDNKKYILGGAANVAANLADLGCQVTLIGKIGKDEHGHIIEKLLNKKGIINSLMSSYLVSTISKTRLVSHDNHQLLRIDEEIDNNYYFTQKSIMHHLDTILFKNSFNAIIISDYGKGTLDSNLIKTIINRYKYVFIDPDTNKINWKTYSGCFCLKPNKKEFEKQINKKINNQREIDLYISKLSKTIKFSNILLTLGSEGMYLKGNDEDNWLTIIPTKKEVFDVSGAGDTVIATLAYYFTKFLCNQDKDIDDFEKLKNAAMIANVAAGIVIGKPGTATVTKDELNKSLLLENNISMMLEV